MEHKIYYLNLSSKQNTSNLLPAHVFTIQVSNCAEYPLLCEYIIVCHMYVLHCKTLKMENLNLCLFDINA